MPATERSGGSRSVQPGLVNENVVGPGVNPFQAIYEKQFGGKPK
jgi:hypothetical protein